MSRFDPIEFVAAVARRLVVEFAEAQQAGTPGLIGSAREHPSRQQLEKMLAPFSAVGSGLVMDSFGGISKQQDIVIYERPYCPVFSINGAPDATYYPTETVIAVGEVKSTINSATLKDSFEKVASVKELKRFAQATPDIFGQDPAVSFRAYSSPTQFACTVAEQFDQANKEKDQVYGFILAGKSALSHDGLLSCAAELWESYPPFKAPNIIVSLDDGFIQTCSKSDLKNTLHLSPHGASCAAMCSDPTAGFPQLVRQLNHIAHHGRTVGLSTLARYFNKRDATPETVNVTFSRPFGRDAST